MTIGIQRKRGGSAFYKYDATIRTLHDRKLVGIHNCQIGGIKKTKEALPRR